MKYIEAKTILSKLRGKDSFFGLTYNMNLYRGCQHACIYCDTRSECYQVGDISQITVKRNALELLRSELASKRKTKGTIGTGSMNDPYMPVEKELQMTRNALSIIAQTKYPVHIITKSDLVIRDYDILQEISKTYAAVSFTITTADDALAQKLEPNAASTTNRLKAIRYLSNKGIYTGVTLMPLLPYINDTPENVSEIVARAKDAGASYVMPYFGVTLRKGSREHLYNAFDESFEGMKEKYQSAFGEEYICNSPRWAELNNVFRAAIKTSNMSDKMKFYAPKIDEQLSLF